MVTALVATVARDPPICAKADQLLIIPPGSQIWQICAGMGIARSRLCSDRMRAAWPMLRSGR